LSALLKAASLGLTRMIIETGGMLVS